MIKTKNKKEYLVCVFLFYIRLSEVSLMLTCRDCKWRQISPFTISGPLPALKYVHYGSPTAKAVGDSHNLSSFSSLLTCTFLLFAYGLTRGLTSSFTFFVSTAHTCSVGNYLIVSSNTCRESCTCTV
jgi:hypothetical protein